MVDKEGETKLPEGNTESASVDEKPKKTISVGVGSKNPVKINAVKRALEAVLQRSSLDVELDVKGFDVPSDVPDQPFGDEETQLGAKNRAEKAYRAYKEATGTFPHLSVGLEGGLEWSSSIQDANGEDTLWCMAWMAIYGKRTTLLAECIASPESKYYSADRKPICCLSKTGTFLLPSSLAALIEAGMELGHADDKVFGRTNSKHKSGSVGILTDGIINRTEYYEHALVLALIPWIRPDVYGAPAKTQPVQQEAHGEKTALADEQESRSLFGSLFCSSRKP